MNNIRTRLVRLTVASTLIFGIGAIGTGSALAAGGTTMGAESAAMSGRPEPAAATEDGATPEPLGCTKLPKLLCMF